MSEILKRSSLYAKYGAAMESALSDKGKVYNVAVVNWKNKHGQMEFGATAVVTDEFLIMFCEMGALRKKLYHEVNPWRSLQECKVGPQAIGMVFGKPNIRYCGLDMASEAEARVMEATIKEVRQLVASDKQDEAVDAMEQLRRERGF